MPKKPRVLVLGATGQVGGALVALLAKNESVDVIAAARNPEKARALGVPSVHLDLDKIETFAPALENIDRVFMATGYTVDMLRQSKDLVNTAKRAGVQQVVHLGACGDDDTRVAHYGWHQFIERAISSGRAWLYTPAARDLHAESARLRRRKLCEAGSDQTLRRCRETQLGRLR